MTKERVSQAEAAKRLGLTPQAIGQWAVKPRAPVGMAAGRRVLLWPDFPRWREAELTKEARGTKERPADQKAAIQRKLIADTVLAELLVAEKEGTLVAASVVEATVGGMADRVRAVLVNVPSNYSLHLERAGVDPLVGQTVLTKIADDLTEALRGVVDDIDDPES